MPNYEPTACSGCVFEELCLERINNPKANSIVSKSLLVKNSTTLLNANQVFRNFYAVKQGILKSTNMQPNGIIHIEDFYFKGETVGFESLYKGIHAFSVTASSEAKVCEIPYINVKKFIDHHPDFSEKLLNEASFRIHLKSKLLHMNVNQRLAIFIYRMIERLPLIGTHIHFPIKQVEISNHLCIAPETMNRVLHNWEKKGVILNMHNRAFDLPNKSILLDIADDCFEC